MKLSLSIECEKFRDQFRDCQFIKKKISMEWVGLEGKGNNCLNISANAFPYHLKGIYIGKMSRLGLSKRIISVVYEIRKILIFSNRRQKGHKLWNK
jgi:hypothetical protein